MSSQKERPMPNTQKVFKFEIKNLTEQGTFEGYLSVYDIVDLGNDVVEKGAFDKTLKESGGEIPLLYMHDQRTPIGSLEVESDQRGLKVKGELVLGVQKAQEVYELMKAGVMKGLSIGFKTVKRKMVKGIRHLQEVKLVEGSVVVFPMMPLATITNVKGEKGLKVRDFDQELERLTLLGTRYRMMNALQNTLDDIYWDWNDEGLDSEEKIQLIDEAIQQFHTAYLELLPQLLSDGKSLDEIEVELPLTKVMEAKVLEAIAVLTKLLPKAESTSESEAGETSKEADLTSDSEAANTSSEELKEKAEELATKAVLTAIKKL